MPSPEHPCRSPGARESSPGRAAEHPPHQPGLLLELLKEQTCTPALAGLQFPLPALQLSPPHPSLSLTNATREPGSFLCISDSPALGSAAFALGGLPPIAKPGLCWERVTASGIPAVASACRQQRATREGGFVQGKQGPWNLNISEEGDGSTQESSGRRHQASHTPLRARHGSVEPGTPRAQRTAHFRHFKFAG